jgi:GNAT superfamily N-acetyltransferase
VVQLRPYQAADQGALVDLWYESWRSVGLQTPIVTKGDLARRMPDDLARRWTVTVAEVDDQLLGFLALCLEEQRLDQLFVSPEAHGRGVGSELFNVALRQMPNGFWLSTQPNNHRARAFYERRGMSVDHTDRGMSGERVVYVFPSPAG